MVWADAAEVARLRAHHQRPTAEDARQRWAATPATPDHDLV
jgi:hypothetical protein